MKISSLKMFSSRERERERERESSKINLSCIKIFIICLFILFASSFGYVSYVYYKYHDVKVIFISGGLGNQLYQYAFGYIFQKRTGKKVLYVKNINENDERPWVRFWLNHYNINVDLFKPNKLERKILKIKKQQIIDLNQCNLECLLKEEKKIHFRKYHFTFFDAKYFNGYENEIRKMFTTLSDKYKDELDEKNLAMIKEMQSHKNSVVVNIRLGDYLRHSDLNICNFDYYKRAMKVFDKMEDVHYYVFSDDMEGAKKYFKTNKPTTYVDINPLEKPYLNLILSSSAKHNIVSNSSFAVWAGLLNGNPDKIVVCPSEFLRQSQNTTFSKERIKEANKTYYPKDWIRIDTTHDKALDVNEIDTKFTNNVIKELKKTVPTKNSKPKK